jgi:S-adenosylmethionine:tRNA ribosyltransferase-isomerase
MNIEEFNYTLPEELIAQHPTDKRSDSRLLQLNPNTEEIIDNNFTNFLSLINRNDLLIFNDTKVIKARIHGHKKSGGKVEVLIEKIINQNSFVGHIGTSKKINAGHHRR